MSVPSVDMFGRCVFCGHLATTAGCVNYKCQSRRELPDTPVPPMPDLIVAPTPPTPDLDAGKRNVKEDK